MFFLKMSTLRIRNTCHVFSSLLNLWDIYFSRSERQSIETAAIWKQFLFTQMELRYSDSELRIICMRIALRRLPLLNPLIVTTQSNEDHQ